MVHIQFYNVKETQKNKNQWTHLQKFTHSNSLFQYYKHKSYETKYYSIFSVGSAMQTLATADSFCKDSYTIMRSLQSTIFVP